MFPTIASCCGFLLFFGCKEKTAPESTTHFTRMDSVAESYLDLKDDMLESWNRLISNDNQRIKAMQNLAHELEVSSPALREELAVYDQKIRQMKEMRYTQQSMENGNAVEEYDFASNALLTEMVTLAESQPEFDYNSTLQKIVAKIRAADQNVIAYREQYDSVALLYNAFITEHEHVVKEVESDTVVKKKPLFHMASEDQR